MVIGTVTIDRGLRLSCPYGPDDWATLTIPLGTILLDLTLTVVGGLAWTAPWLFSLFGVWLGAVALLIIALVLLLCGPLAALLMTARFLSDQLLAEPVSSQARRLDRVTTRLLLALAHKGDIPRSGS
jgi:hypothetical protein